MKLKNIHIYKVSKMHMNKLAQRKQTSQYYTLACVTNSNAKITCHSVQCTQ